MTPRPRILSLAYLTVRGASPPEQIDCASRCGYSHVGFRFLPVIEHERLSETARSPQALDATRKRLDDTGIRLLDVEFFWLRPATVVADFEPYLAAAAQLGAQNVLAGACDPDRRRLTDHWLALCDLAARHGLRANLEFMPFPDMTTLNSYAEAMAFVLAAAHPNGGVTIDSLHFERSGSRLSDVLPAHHARMSYMQLCDAPAGAFPVEEMQRQAREDRLPPGRGGLDLVGLLKALPTDLPISLEVPLGGAVRDWPLDDKARFVLAAARDLVARADLPIETQ